MESAHGAREAGFRVALVRHPRVLIGPGICYGRLDVPLHALGEAQIGRIADEVGTLADAPVWSSPARRCLVVAARLSPAARVDARLLELDFGAWEGLAWDDVDRAALDRWAADARAFAPPGGESGAALVARVEAFAAMLREARRDCVVVSHGGPLRVLRALLTGGAVDLLAAAPALGSVEVVTVPPTG